MKKRYYLLTILFLWATGVWAQGIKFTASVSDNPVGTGEEFEVKFFTDGSIDSFDPPDFNGFNVVGGPNQSSSFSSVNGQTSINVSISYILVATRVGEYTIGPAVMKGAGKTYKSNPLKIKVIKGRPVPQQQSSPSGREGDAEPGNTGDLSSQIFMRAIPSKTNVYQGEQLTVSYKLYANVAIVDNQPDKMPDFNGFWSEEIKNTSGNVRWQVENYEGKRYHVAVLKQIILFPERFGTLELDPLAMTFVVRQTVPSNDPIEQFFGGGSYKDSKIQIKSPVVKIHVKALPESGQPDGFRGAVGNFSISAALDRTELKANEAMNYTIKVSGSGNLKLLKAPELELAPDIEKYDPKIEDHINENAEGVSGSRSFSYLLIPRHEGNYTIDPLKFSYFNPETGKYTTLSTSAFPVKVNKGAPGSDIVAYSGGQQDVKVLDKDIRYIKSETDHLHRPGDGLFGSGLYYGLLSIGPLLFAGALVYRKWYRMYNKDQVAVRGRKANKLASKHLANALAKLKEGEKAAFYEAIFRGLYGYLGDKLNLASADLNREKIREELAGRGLSDSLSNRLMETLDLCEMARYSPVQGVSEQEVYESAKSIINDIEDHA